MRFLVVGGEVSLLFGVFLCRCFCEGFFGLFVGGRELFYACFVECWVVSVEIMWSVVLKVYVSNQF